MEEILKLLVGAGIVFLGWPIGDFLKFLTRDEMKSGRKWFKLIVLVSLIGMAAGLFFNDVLFFTFAFIAMVTSRSLNN